MNKALKFVIWLLAAAVILFFVTDMPHIFRSARSAARSSDARSILVNLSSATSLYTNDYDGRFFPATSMSTVRVLLQPYEKELFSNKTYDLPDDPKKFNWRAHDKFSEPKFNFNLACVSYEDALNPIGFGTVESKEVVEYFLYDSEFSRIIGIDLEHRHIQYPDPSTLNEEDFFCQLSYQFDRKGARLFPPDYLAGQDPLK